jgi:peptidoglycan/LPS O-acetylase OafA/YrhL
MTVSTDATNTIIRPSFHLCGLDALRGVAAIVVVLWHVLYLKRRLGLASHEWLENTPVINRGPMAVTFFFVLSGFLITLLLLRER